MQNTPALRSRLLIGAVAAGIAFGFAAPEWTPRLKPVADGFVTLLGWLAGPLLFCMLAASAARLREGPRLGRAGLLALPYFALTALASLALGMLVAWVLEPGAGLELAAPVPAGAAQRPAVDRAFVAPALPALHLNVLLLLCALPCGLLAQTAPGARAAIEHARRLLLRAVELLLALSPLAAFCAMSHVVGQYGLRALLPLLAFVVAVNLASILFVVFGLGTALRLAGVALGRLLRYLRRELLLVFVTGSSLAGLAPLARRLEQLGCPAPLTGLVLPLSYSLNLAGTYVYLGAGIVFLAQAARVALGWPDLLAIAGVALVTSRTAASVAGSGFATLAATLAVLQIVPAESVALLLGIDRTMKCRLLTNVFGHGVACIVLAAGCRGLDRATLERELEYPR